MENYSNKILVYIGLVVLGMGMMAACSESDEPMHTVVKGHITVSDSIDQSGNYSGIEVLIFHKKSSDADADTLFLAQTDSNGYFNEEAVFEKEGFYPMQVSRNKSVVGRSQVVLDHLDTLHLSAVLPSFDKTVTFASRQHDALNLYNRVNYQFRRVAGYIQSGVIEQDSIPSEIRKWSNIFWEVYKRYPSTFGGRMAATESVDLTMNLTYENARERIQQLTANEKTLPVAATFGRDLISGEKGLEKGIKFLDSLRTLSENLQILRQIDQIKIELLYDSARVDAAKDELAAFKENYAEQTESQNWAKHIGYDLEYLAPGDTLPPFSVTTLKGRKISQDSLTGSPFILEITELANDLYKQQYDRSFVIKNLYAKTGLEYITLPLDASMVTVEAFFEARGGAAWPVASINSFDNAEILERYNVNRTPVRFVVDSKGKIIKKLVGNEYEDVIKYIPKNTQNNKENS